MSAGRGILPALLLCLLLTALPARAAQAAPLQLRWGGAEETWQLEVVATEEGSLSNFDFSLNWARECLELVGVDSPLPLHALEANLNPDSPRAGAVSAVADGEDLSFRSGDVLLRYVFSAPEGLRERCAFTLEVTDAALASGQALPWVGSRLDLEAAAPQSEMVLSRRDGRLSVLLPALREDALLLCAAYGQDGRLLTLDCRPVPAGTSAVQCSADPAPVRVFLLDPSLRPLCPAGTG